MSWVEPFYSETGRWWGGAEASVTDRDHARVSTLRRLTGVDSGRLLDLGCSYGNTPAAFALAGYDVTGVEISDRISFAAQHAHVVGETPTAGSLTFIRGDFLTLELNERFDLVTYWNGFGIGSDAEQRTLLDRIAQHWLRPAGCLVLDVFNPAQWTRWAGEVSQLDAAPSAGYPYSVTERTDYDPVRARFLDTWSRDGQDRELTQSQRCYSPADLVLLLEPTDLEVVAAEVDGCPLALDQPADSLHPLFDAHEYQVCLRSVTPADR
jgi:SAM-dependent methyltransferase